MHAVEGVRRCHVRTWELRNCCSTLLRRSRHTTPALEFTTDFIAARQGSVGFVYHSTIPEQRTSHSLGTHRACCLFTYYCTRAQAPVPKRNRSHNWGWVCKSLAWARPQLPPLPLKRNVQVGYIGTLFSNSSMQAKRDLLQV